MKIQGDKEHNKNGPQTWTENFQKKKLEWLIAFLKMVNIIRHGKLKLKLLCNSIHPSQNNYHKESKWWKMLARMWEKRHLHLLLVGLQTGAATVEIRVRTPHKAGNRTACDLGTLWLPHNQRNLYPTAEILAHLCSLLQSSQ